jgi:hypothetical protein
VKDIISLLIVNQCPHNVKLLLYSPSVLSRRGVQRVGEGAYSVLLLVGGRVVGRGNSERALAILQPEDNSYK